MKSRLVLRLLGVPIGIVAALLVLAAARTDAVKRLELSTVDARLAVRGDLPLDPRIVLVDVDDETLKLLGWPLPRGFYAQLVDVAHQHGAKAVGFDVLFLEETDAAQDALLERAAIACRCAVFPAQLSFDAAHQPVGVERPLPSLWKASAAHAHVQLDNGIDGVFRASVLEVRHDDLAYTPLGVAIARVAGVPVTQDVVAADRAQLSWRSAAGDQLRTASILDVLGAADAKANGEKPTIDLDKMFSGALVIVGQSAKSVGDRGAVPSSPDAPLVLVHANLIDNVINDRLLVSPPPALAALAVVLLAVLAGAAVTALPALWGALSVVALALVWLMGAQAAFASHTALPVAAPIMAVVLAFLGSSVANIAVRDADERRMKRLFSRYVAPHILEQVMKNPDAVDIRGHKRTITLLFSDIKGYTTLSNTLPPDAIVELLCSYLDTMVGILLDNEGTVDKIMGDGIMAFFGDPVTREDHALRCVKAALAMQRATEKLGEKWVQQGLSPLQVRIGIATGEVFVGTIGSRDHLEYTAIGRPVNLASRLEGKAPPGGVLVSKETWALIQDHVVGVEARGLDLKGYSTGYDAWQVLGLVGEVGEVPAQNQRRNNRRPFFSDVELVLGGATLQAQSSDVSPGGMFVVCDTLPPEGTRVQLSGKLARGEQVRVDAVVTHVREGKPGTAGVGLMFTSVFADDRAAIHTLLAGVLGEDGYEDQRIEEGGAGEGKFRYTIERASPAELGRD